MDHHPLARAASPSGPTGTETYCHLAEQRLQGGSDRVADDQARHQACPPSKTTIGWFKVPPER